jgi:response regulator RpfG family c-di-GMP phosphodiesterase
MLKLLRHLIGENINCPGSPGRLLERQGYQVLAADSPSEAISLARQYAGKIQLLITDVVMPEMNGRELAEQICAINPEMKTLFMSGYHGQCDRTSGYLEEGVNFINKPFSMKDLGDKVRECGILAKVKIKRSQKSIGLIQSECEPPSRLR